MLLNFRREGDFLWQSIGQAIISYDIFRKFILELFRLSLRRIFLVESCQGERKNMGHVGAQCESPLVEVKGINVGCELCHISLVLVEHLSCR